MTLYSALTTVIKISIAVEGQISVTRSAMH